MAAAAKKHGVFVLENKMGQVVRTLHLDSDQIFLVIRQDTKRVEVLGDLSDFEEREIPFTLISAFSADDIRKKPFMKEGLGSIRFLDQVEVVSPLHHFEEEDENDMKYIAKWIAIAHIGLLLLVIGGSKIYRSFTEEELVTVQVVKQDEIKKEIPKPPVEVQKTVKVSEKKITKVVKKQSVQKVKPKYEVKRQVPVKSVKSFVAKSKPHAKPSEGPKVKNKSRELNEMGALGAIGGFNKAAGKRAGLDIGSVSKGGIAGLGAGSGRSGTDRAISASGLVAMSAGGGSGSGAGAGGGGGYNTRGMGTGHSGYGKHSMAGSSSGFVAPMESEGEVEGGLEKSQIDAVVRRNMGQILYCYEKSLQSKPGIKGRVHMAWVIGGNGRVKSSRVEDSSVNEAQVESCIAGKIRGWKFPSPKGNMNVSVTYPFQLSRTM